MTEIIKFSERDDPHVSSAARCAACHHEWMSVAPVGCDYLECPNCKRLWGQFKSMFEPPEGWLIRRHHCGNDLFYLTTAGPFCRGCGQTIVEW